MIFILPRRGRSPYQVSGKGNESQLSAFPIRKKKRNAVFGCMKDWIVREREVIDRCHVTARNVAEGELTFVAITIPSTAAAMLHEACCAV